MALLSIVGLWNSDNTIWEGFNVPDGMNKDLATTFIMSECQELEIVYPDPGAMKFMISNWSAMYLPIWERLYKTTTLEYNPIENYNRTEEWEDDRVVDIERTDNRTLNKEYGKGTTITNSRTGNDTLSQTGTDTITPGQITTNSAKAFNDSNFVEREKTELSGENVHTPNLQDKTEYNSTFTNAETGKDTESGSDNVKTTGTNIDNLKRKGTAKGNIGVTTTQEMLKQEREIATFNVYMQIVDSFKENFCILIW